MRLPITTASATARDAPCAVAASRMPKPTPTGSLTWRADARHASRDVAECRGCRRRSRPSATRSRRSRWRRAPTCCDALVGRGRREQEDRVDAVRLAAARRSPRTPRAGSRRPARRRRRRLCASRDEASRMPIALDRVRIAHQHHRRRRCPPCGTRAPCRARAQADAVRQRALAGALDHRAVGHRVGERHAELDDVGAACDQRVHQRHGERRRADRRR